MVQKMTFKKNDLIVVRHKTQKDGFVFACVMNDSEDDDKEI
jgi:hypothetical protein